MEGDVTERTPLHPATGAPMYVFAANQGRLYRNRVRHFQCCICASLLAIFVLGIVIAVSYSINDDIEDRNSTNPNATEMAWQQLQVLLSINWPIDDEPPRGEWPTPGPSQEEVSEAVAAGSTAAFARMHLESAMPQMPVDSPSYRHQMAVATGPAANTRARAGFATDEATKMLVKDIGKAPGVRGPRVSAPWQPDDVCADEDGVDAGGFPPCPPAIRGSPWRAQDGRCNNLAHPWLGAALRPFRRVLPADYADGVSAPRTGRGGSSLPSAREVSITVHRPQYRDDAAFSILLAVWGQFIDHDITATALSKRSTDGGVISCCYAAQSSGLKAHPECFPVMLGPGDPFFEQYNVTCMEFVRSAPAPACRFGPREQLNQATSFLDASVVYGPSEELMTQLRSGLGGRLRMLVTEDGRELLPASTDPNDGCNREEESTKGRYCFFSGDARGNENLHLTTMHLLLAREHNRLARALQERNPSWADERLFQEARRIVSAQMQHITYNEFVPILLGNELMTKLGLHPLDEGYSRDYDPKIDPRIGNVFAAAAFRFAHTLLPGLMRMISNTSSEYVELHKVLFNPFALYTGEGPVLRGAINPGLLRFDPHFSPQVSEHLFERSVPRKGAKGPCGLDLVSLNIQRGRDHGLPPYSVWRRHCGFSEPKSFGDLQGVFDDDSLSRVAAIFKSVDDIDPYSGMLAEMPIQGGMLGPTLSCILSDQFVRLRRGDRYWYETGELPQAFSPAQLQEVRKTSLALLLCDTSDSVTSIQRWVLRAPGDDNPRVPCASLPRLNIDAWKGSPDPAPPTPLGPAVHIQGSSASARSFGPGVPPIGDIVAGTTMMLPLRLGAYILSARVSSSAGHAWYAAFPLELPLPLFDSINPGGGNVAPPPTAGAHGILWEGTLVHSSPGFLKFTGEFSLPKYIHGDGDTNFSIEWINGDFEFQLQVLWNTSDISALNIDGSYSSPVYVGGRKKYAALQNETASKLFDVTGEFRESPSLDIDPVVKKAPIILLGTYSPDGSTFLWSGNVSATIPDAVPATPWSKSSYWSETIAEVPLSPMPWIPRSPRVETLSVSAEVSSALQISVLSGRVTLSSNGSSDSIWDGTLPLSIPIPETKKKDNVPSSPEVAYGGGLTWDATLQRIDNTTLNVQGKFSLPIFVKDTDAPFSIEWKEGDFSFDFTIIWNIASLDVMFQERHSYSSPLYFRESKSSDTVNDIIVGMQESKLVEGSAELQFVATTVADAANLPKVPIILKGTFSSDKTHFIWDGYAIIIFPTATKFQPLQMYPKKTSGTVAIGANVLSGSIIGQANGQTSSSLWKGDLPMPIRRPDIITRGITWRGELTFSSPIEAQLQSSFSVLLPGEPNSTFPFILYQGKVSLQLGLLWNVSVDGLLPKGVTAFSPIYLRGSTAPDDAESWFQSDEEPICHCSYMSNVQAPKGSFIVPIILQGAYSSDLSTFWWSGKALLVFSKPIIPPKVMIKTREKLIITHSTHKTPSLTSWYGVPWENQAAPTQPGIPFMRPLRLGATVRSGSIRTTAGRAWSGSLPLQLKLPLFDTTEGSANAAASLNDVPVAFAHGILWEGTISSTTAGKVSFYGQFSMPRYVHRSGGLYNVSIQWINGDFDFDLDLLWNTSDVTGLAIQGSYSSPLFLNAEKKYKYLINKTMNSVANVEGALSQLPSLTPSPVIKKSPIILLGMYSPDGGSFMWSGNVTIVIPDIVPVPSWTTSRSWTEDNVAIPFPRSPLVPENARTENLAAIDGASPAMGVTITGGHVIVASNETNISLWDGSLPLSIPMHAFNNVKNGSKQFSTNSESESIASYSSGVIWDASLERVANNKLHVEGNFSVPIFDRGPGALFGINWEMGIFDLDIGLLWNSTSLDEVIQEGIKYYSPVFFSASKSTDTINDIIVNLQQLNGVEGNVELQFVADAVAEAAAAPRAPIILMGSFSLDKSQFLWNGNATIFLPSPIALTTLLQKKISTDGETKQKKVITGANVLSGSVIAGAAMTAPSTLWSGELPVPIRRPDLLSRGIIWRGSIHTTSLKKATIDGNFSAMWPSTEGEKYPFTLYQGKFSIELDLLWYVSVDKILPPDISVYSPIYLHASTIAPQSESWFAVADDLGREEKQINPPPEAAGAIFVPIILQGSYSPDLTTFWWNGRAIIPFPGPSNTPHIERNQKNLILTSPRLSMPNTLSKKEADMEVTYYRPLRLGATVTSGSITTSMGKVWPGSLPLEIPLPLFDSVATTDDSSPSTPIYSHGILWEGSLYTSSEGYVSLSGKFSMPHYIHGRGLTNFSIEWVNGNFHFDLAVIWNSSDIRNLNVQGSYSSPLYLSAKKYYSYLQRVKLAKLSDLIKDIKLTSSVKVESVVKKAPLILLGTYSPTGKSFLWSGNVSLTIPDVVSVPSRTSLSKLKEASPEEPSINNIPVIPMSSVAMGISVKGGSINVLTNRTSCSRWNGSLPLSISSSTFNRDLKDPRVQNQKSEPGKSKPIYASGLVWEATLQRLDNTTIRLSGNYCVPIFEHRPSAIFAIDWKEGDFSLDFIVDWNRTSLDNIFKENTKYTSPVYFRVSKSTNTLKSIELLHESNDAVGDAELQFVSESIADAGSLPRAPIVLFGNYSADNSNFYWYGSALIIVPAIKDPTMLQTSISSSSGSPIDSGSRTVGGEVVDGSISVLTKEMSLSTLWDGELPFPIRRPDVIARGITWKGEFLESSMNETKLEGSFSTTWPSPDGATSKGKFALKIDLLWYIPLIGLLPPGAIVYSPIYLKGTTISNMAHDESWFPDINEITEPSSDVLHDVATNLQVPIILQGIYSPDLSTFWWTGRVILSFPPPAPWTKTFVRTASSNSGSVSAIVTSGLVATSDGSKLWNGALPVTLSPGLKSFKWSGSVSPAVGGTVELRGMFTKGKTTGNYAFVLTPLWNTPITDRVNPGMNYSSKVIMRDADDPALPLLSGAQSGNNVPIILLGSFSPDKSTFKWEGSVVIELPNTV